MILAALLGTQTCFSMASHQDSFGILLSMSRFLLTLYLKPLCMHYKGLLKGIMHYN